MKSFSSFHLITSSARASRMRGTSRPKALAVLRSSIVSYLAGACNGRSDGLAPAHRHFFSWKRLRQEMSPAGFL